MFSFISFYILLSCMQVTHDVCSLSCMQVTHDTPSQEAQSKPATMEIGPRLQRNLLKKGLRWSLDKKTSTSSYDTKQVFPPNFSLFFCLFSTSVNVIAHFNGIKHFKILWSDDVAAYFNGTKCFEILRRNDVVAYSTPSARLHETTRQRR